MELTPEKQRGQEFITEMAHWLAFNRQLDPDQVVQDPDGNSAYVWQLLVPECVMFMQLNKSAQEAGIAISMRTPKIIVPGRH